MQVRFLTGVRRRPVRLAEEDGYPFALPMIEAFERLDFTTPVTFFVGENGSGKSTLLEGLAAACGAISAGSHDLFEDETLSGPRRLGNAMIVERRENPRTRLFMRAEDVFGFTKRVDGEMRDLAAREADLREEGPIAKGSGRERMLGVLASARREYATRYRIDPHAQSHGETFLQILKSRLAPGGLYLLDEPETPLSPTRVLALMAMIMDGVREGSQFVIATHSPILLAIPGATILGFANDRIEPVAWEDVEHVSITRAFLKNPERFLRHLTED